MSLTELFEKFVSERLSPYGKDELYENEITTAYRVFEQFRQYCLDNNYKVTIEQIERIDLNLY